MSLAAEPASQFALPAAETFPIPAYVYDLAEVHRNQARLRAALPSPTRLYYSLKANPHPALGHALATDGVLPEVCSTGELHAALEAGWSGADVLYTGPGKRDEEITAALAAGVRHFSLDSPYALDQLDRLAVRADTDVHALLRINDDQPVPGQGLTMTGVTSQFGIDTGWVLAEPTRFISRRRVQVQGLHLYMGTNLTRSTDLLAQFDRALNTAVRLGAALAPHGVRLRVLDLGGGFGAPFARHGDALDFGDLRDPLTALLEHRVPGWDTGTTTIAFESGRYLVGTAGTLVTTVLDVKRSQGKDVVVLASGINHLGGMSGLRRLPPLTPQVQHPDLDATQPRLDALVTGPLCTPLDTWARNADLPAVAPGDTVTVPNVGAYGLSASLIGFLGHPLPTEVVIDSDNPTAAPKSTRLQLIRTTVSNQE